MGDRLCVALHVGDEACAVAWGSGLQATEAAGLAVGMHDVAARFFPTDRVSLLAVEEAIAAVEDIVMPWHGRWPHAARLVACDPQTRALADWSGLKNDGDVCLSVEAVEQLFNRWAALVQGRPSSQDPLPLSGPFAATLLFLREWLHHVGFNGVTVLADARP
jgi:hypothetical protein